MDVQIFGEISQSVTIIPLERTTTTGTQDLAFSYNSARELRRLRKQVQHHPKRALLRHQSMLQPASRNNAHILAASGAGKCQVRSCCSPPLPVGIWNRTVRLGPW